MSILGSAALSATNLSSMSLVAVHVAALDRDQAIFALSDAATNLSDPGLAAVQLAAMEQLSATSVSSAGFAAVHGPARGRSVTNSQVEMKESRPLASIPPAIATQLMTPGYPVGGGGCRSCAVAAVPPLASGTIYPGLAMAMAHSVTVTPPHPLSP